MRGSRAFVLFALALSAVVLVASPARAEHLPDHRYFIEGTVSDELGRPVCGVTVRAADVDRPSPESNRTASTDGAGHYQIQLHLHGAFDLEANAPRTSHNVDDRILVTIEGTGFSSLVTAQNNSANRDGWGQRTVDFSTQGLADNCLGLEEIAPVALGILFVVALLVAVLFLRRGRRRVGRGAGAALMRIPGVGRARVKELASAGIRSVEDLAAANPDTLSSKTTLTPKQARLLVKRAKEQSDE
jgi:hypothetical protein